jgi:hypothetical protein
LSLQCFLPGTLVEMEDGTRKPIEEIVVDDEVRSASDRTGGQAAGKVARLFPGETDRVCYLTLVPERGGRTAKHRVGVTREESGDSDVDEPPAGGAQTIRCTPSHPFSKIEESTSIAESWVPAGTLRVGERVRGADGDVLVVCRADVRAEHAWKQDVETPSISGCSKSSPLSSGQIATTSGA